MDNFESSAILMKYRGDSSDGKGIFDRYVLESVIVREVFAADSEAVSSGGVTLYFLLDRSVCRAEGGNSVTFPRLACGDMISLYVGGEESCAMRVFEVGYFSGGGLSHVRIKLK